MIKFVIPDDEQEKINEWIESLHDEQIAIMREKIPNYDEITMEDEVYSGAIGGHIRYEFIPTSLGDIVVVHDSITGKSFNATEATDWKYFG
jgi:hypothetical protein